MAPRWLFIPPLLVACGGSDGPEWRLPCAGVGMVEGSSPLMADQYVFEHDGAGNQTFYSRFDASGNNVLTIGRELVDGLISREEATGINQDYLYEAEIEGGRIRSYRFDFGLADIDYQATLTWDGGDLTRVDYTGQREGFATFEATDDGFVERTSIDGGRDVATYVGADFVGDYTRWTSATYDLGDDGVIERTETRSFDPHGLELSYEDRVGAEQALYLTRTHDREADGTALSTRSEYTQPPSVYTLTYDFDCAAP
jgi:hypothetical protein